MWAPLLGSYRLPAQSHGFAPLPAYALSLLQSPRSLLWHLLRVPIARDDEANFYSGSSPRRHHQQSHFHAASLTRSLSPPVAKPASCYFLFSIVLLISALLPCPPLSHHVPNISLIAPRRLDFIFYCHFLEMEPITMSQICGICVKHSDWWEIVSCFVGQGMFHRSSKCVHPECKKVCMYIHARQSAHLYSTCRLPRFCSSTRDRTSYSNTHYVPDELRALA